MMWRSRTTQWLLLGILGSFCVLALLFLYYGDYPIYFGLIPPISGRVVDAITQKPISGLDVTLRASYASGFGGIENTLRYENKVTEGNGEFDFMPSLSGGTDGLFQQYNGHSITVNYRFRPIQQLNTKNAFGMDALGSTDAVETIDTVDPDLSYLVLDNPLFIGNPNFVNNSSYFPILITFPPKTCKTIWNATCLSLSHTTGVTVELIPVLSNPKDCESITDVGIQGKRIELNTYFSIYSQATSTANVGNNKSLCNSTDQGDTQVQHNLIAQECLAAISRYEQGPPVLNPL
jgi:hypothetical protein